MSYKHSNPRWWRDAAYEQERWLEVERDLHRIARERRQAERDDETVRFVRRVGTLIPLMFIGLILFATVLFARDCDRPARKVCPCAESPT